MNRIFIDGQEFSDVGGLDELEVVYELDDETRTVNFNTTRTLFLSGDAYEYVNSFYFEDCSNWTEQLSVSIELDCCDLVLPFVLTYEGLERNTEECIIEARLVRNDEGTRCFRQLQNTIFWRENGQVDPGFLAYDNHPRVHYCVERFGLLNRMLFILRALISPLLAVGGIIDTIIDAISDLLGGDDVNIPSLETFDAFFSGCGHYNIAPLVRKIISYQTDKCGIDFKSSILNTAPYNRMVLYMAQYVEGYDDDEDGVLNPQQAANLTVLQLLNLLRPVFNADFRIKDETLYFERVDFFDDFSGETIDLTDYDVNYEFEPVQAYAFGRYEYSLDAFDFEGNKVASKYNDLVEWNFPPKDYQKGERSTVVEFSPASFLFDEAARQSVNNGGYRHEMDLFRSDNTPIFGNQGDRRGRQDMIVTNHTCSQLRLLVLEENYKWNDAVVINKPVGAVLENTQPFPIFDYNYPLYFDPEYPEEELYQRFHYIDNPRRRGFVFFRISEIQAPLTCALANAINENATDLLLETAIGRGKADRIIIDFGSGIVKFQNIRVKCSQ